MDKITESTVETIEIVKCTTGYIVYLHDTNGDIVATRAITQLGSAQYSGLYGSVLSAIEEAFLINGEI